MNVMFASGDVGGARALLPVMELCEKKSMPFVMLENGHIIREAPKRWERISFGKISDRSKVIKLFKYHHIGVLVFSSSVMDTTALNLARNAKDLGITVIHVLDSWTGYRRRMETDGLPAFVPDIYTVMDNYALEEAIKEGIEKRILRVTGQPALARLYEAYFFNQGSDNRQKRKRFGFNPCKPLIFFISEPVEHDQGASAESPQYRGYTEKTVLRSFVESLQPFSDRIEIGLLPHPREDVKGLQEIWDSYRGALEGRILDPGMGSEGIFLGDGFVGMASILLYKAWLLGKPAMSLQPGLRLAPLRMFEKREGIKFVDSNDSMHAAIIEWVSKIQTETKTTPLPELQMYREAPNNVFKIVQECLRERINGRPVVEVRPQTKSCSNTISTG